MLAFIEMKFKYIESLWIGLKLPSNNERVAQQKKELMACKSSYKCRGIAV